MCHGSRKEVVKNLKALSDGFNRTMAGELGVAISDAKNLTVASVRLFAIELHEALGKKDAGMTDTQVPSLGADFAPSGRRSDKLSQRLVGFKARRQRVKRVMRSLPATSRG